LESNEKFKYSYKNYAIGVKINKIENITYLNNYTIKVLFDDGFCKELDFLKLIEFKGIAEQLRDIEYFKQVKILRNGRSFGWDNTYDCCADWARKL